MAKSNKDASVKRSIATEVIFAPGENIPAKTRTVYVVPRGDGWAVQRQGGGSIRTHATQRDAIKEARSEVKIQSSGQIVVYGRDGQIRERNTYKMPPIQNPPGKRSAKIEKAVDKVTRDRLGADPLPPRG